MLYRLSPQVPRDPTLLAVCRLPFCAPHTCVLSFNSRVPLVLLYILLPLTFCLLLC